MKLDRKAAGPFPWGSLTLAVIGGCIAAFFWGSPPLARALDAAPAAAFPQPIDPAMPSYSASAACRDDDPNDSSILGQRGCLEAQYNARYSVSAEWNDAPPSVRAECIANDGSRDYGLLLTCLDSHRNDAKVGAH